MRNFTQLLKLAIEGDLNSFSIYRDKAIDFEICEESGVKFTVKREALRNVLNSWRNKEYADELVQEWASFVRRGYIASSHDFPIVPLAIEYECPYEECIADVIDRLDQIGDKIDGIVSASELDEIIVKIPL